ncbi:TetR family transcriptional regulator [Nakamurella silvestris]|nr:TetR family transcriptional regulator [Nakamurella silvestris]
MGRWETGAGERLRVAALDLFSKNGFEGVTVAEIAAAAGLTERTFFRHYSDKREVLFDGQDRLEGLFLQAVAESRAVRPMELVTEALSRSAEFFGEDRRPWSRSRQTVIDANPALLERESLKMNSLAAALASGIEARGVLAVAATLAADSGISAFRMAFSQWIVEGEERSFEQIQAAVLDELRTVVGLG